MEATITKVTCLEKKEIKSTHHKLKNQNQKVTHVTGNILTYNLKNKSIANNNEKKISRIMCKCRMCLKINK